VAKSSVFPEGFPQDEQKRTPLDNSVPQLEHEAMIFARNSISQRAGADVNAGVFRP
jgi:hypothetical protein